MTWVAAALVIALTLGFLIGFQHAFERDHPSPSRRFRMRIRGCEAHSGRA